jgi:hypothetical protein
VKQGKRRESERDRWTSIRGLRPMGVAGIGENHPSLDDSESGKRNCARSGAAEEGAAKASRADQ